MVAAATGREAAAMNQEQMPADALDDCRSCKARFVWATHQRTLRPMPVDVAPSADGNLALAVTAAGAVTCRVVKPELAYGRQDLHKSHFATCPDADRHRRPRGGASRD
ncbi:hypothetical protein [Micromonospora sp. 4G55]|uniref:hypothetical protein n=1 Tax=Micromonospora sp. 4G55 TaxID=2806102 RepID=UPI001A4E6616|nr:hypothetical protein [Micromonospora sp. 4G55]MBM0256374.1 hypothetical protein [Micromonospora sp. 4G55]